MDSFVVDRGHPNGPEIHSVTDTGIIVVHNQRTGKMVTKLIARPGQVKIISGNSRKLNFRDENDQTYK